MVIGIGRANRNRLGNRNRNRNILHTKKDFYDIVRGWGQYWGKLGKWWRRDQPQYILHVLHKHAAPWSNSYISYVLQLTFVLLPKCQTNWLLIWQWWWWCYPWIANTKHIMEISNWLLTKTLTVPMSRLADRAVRRVHVGRQKPIIVNINKEGGWWWW